MGDRLQGKDILGTEMRYFRVFFSVISGQFDPPSAMTRLRSDSAHAHLLLAGAGHEVEEGHALVAAGLCVSDPGETRQLEAHGVSPLASVHVVSKGEDELQHPPQPLASLNLLTRLEDSQDFWFDLIVPDVELLLVMERSQSLLVMRYPAINISYLQLRDTRRPFFMLPRHGK